MKLSVKSILLASVAVIMSISTSAQRLLSNALQEAVQAALTENTTIKNNKLALSQLDHHIGMVKEKSHPSLSFTGGGGYFAHTLALDLPTVHLPIVGTALLKGSTKMHTNGLGYLGMLNLKQVIYAGRQIHHGVEALKAKKQGQYYMNQTAKDHVILQVIEAFDQLRYLAQLDLLITESEKRLEKENQRVNKAISLGLAIPYDRDKLKLARLELKARQMELQGTKQLLYMNIGKLTNYTPAQIDAVTYHITPFLLQQNNLGIENRQELKALQQFDKALTFKLKKEKGSFLPSIGAFASVGYAGVFETETKFNLPISGNPAKLDINHLGLNPQVIVGLALKWDISKNFGRQYEKENILIDKAILANKREETEKLMTLQLKNAKLQYQTLQNQLQVAQQKQNIAKNNLKTASQQYKLGLIGITERLAAETDVIKTATDYYKLLVAQRKSCLAVYSAQGRLQQMTSNN